jgi:hypothetical protein
MTVLHTCPTCAVVITLEKASVLDLIVELENRERQGTGMWPGNAADRIMVLAKKLNPPPINP